MPEKMPATAPSAGPMKNASVIDRLMSMPMRPAASRSCEVARIALPMRVRDTKVSRATMSEIGGHDDEHLEQCSLAPPAIVKAVLLPSGFGNGSCLESIHSRTAFCRKIETPIAEMSGASRGA